MNESALKEKLKTIAAEKGTTVNKLWKQLVLERFLARLSDSVYQDKFIFKGGLLLAQYIALNRETVDVDFLMTNLHSQKQTVEGIMKEVAEVNSNDGFSFSWFAIEELTQPHMEYAGFRVTLNVQFGKMRDKIQIDIGVGDVVEPVELSYGLFEYKGKPLFAGEITLHVYPPETILAEKLETIVSKGAINSRMKDYHDVLVMLREPDFLDVTKLADSIKSTFSRRNTQTVESIQFNEQGLQSLQALWSQHLRGLGLFKEQLGFPETIQDVIGEINRWIKLNEVL